MAVVLSFILTIIPAITPTRAAAGVNSVSEAMPGAPAFPNALRAQLAKTLNAKSADYVPRTRNLGPSGAPLYTNRLLLETSPYLQQHAHNPVNWFPWGDEAFETARELGRPVLVSIGYSTCHWCHVMEEESFEDPVVAEYLNANFIAVKVDREVRPDVDAIYMAAIHAMGVSGGWPLNVWVTPDRKPFYGATYFPPKATGGRPSFRQALEAIAAQYATKHDDIVQQAEQLAAHLKQSLSGTAVGQSAPVPAEAIATVVRFFTDNSDDTWGGLNRAPKFPSSLPTRLMLRYAHRTGETLPVKVANLALERMAAGGIHDQIGGGFHRYSTDTKWLVPHFEKMLYDNALLIQDYVEAWQKTGVEQYANVAKKTLRYVAKELTAPGGGFYSATDADSKNFRGETEEGFFFSWTPAEIEAAIGSDKARVVYAYYGVTSTGNFEGRNLFRTWRSDEDVAAELGIDTKTLHQTLDASRGTLYEVRAKRPAPLLDDKVLVGWNGLMISAFARAGFAFNDRDLVTRAGTAATFILDNMRIDGRLARVYMDGAVSGPAFLEDYAFFIKALLDLYEASPKARWLDEAISLQNILDQHYADTVSGGYYQTADDGEQLIAREKPDRDGAIPSGNSIAALNLLRLYHYTTKAVYLERAEMLFSAFARELRTGTTAASEMYIALDFMLDTAKEIIVVTTGPGPDLDAMLAPLRTTFMPNRVVSIVTEGADLDEHAKRAPILKGKRALGGKATAYVCENRVCKFPTDSPEVFAKQISKINPYAFESETSKTGP